MTTPDVFVQLAEKIVDEHCDGIVLGRKFDGQFVEMVLGSLPDFREQPEPVIDLFAQRLCEAFDVLRTVQNSEWIN